MPSKRLRVTIYTDGACIGNPGPGGWAAIIYDGQQERLLQGGSSYTTNNRMELRAAIAALSALPEPRSVHLHTDSEYLRLGITSWLPRWLANGWRTATKGRVKNQDLWKTLLAVQEQHDVHWHWVKAHAHDPDNQRVDLLARAAARSLSRRAPRDLEKAGD